MSRKPDVVKTVRGIRRHSRKKYSAEEKIRIVLEGLRGEDRIAELCRREGINTNVYYRWSKEFWKPVRSVFPAMLSDKPPPMKSKHYVL